MNAAKADVLVEKSLFESNKNKMADSLTSWLQQQKFHSVLPFPLSEYPFVTFDFTDQNEELAQLDTMNREAFESYVFGKIEEQNAVYGIGLYLEDRSIYRRSSVFENSDESRSLHLGVDLWIETGTPIFAPLDGVVHSFNNNDSFGDYGPTLILEHSYPDGVFYTLYGHLSKKSMKNWQVGRKVKGGEQIAELGSYDENVGYPAHLHFQVIKNIGGYVGDYPGVCKPSEKEKWAENSPDPSVILGVDALQTNN
jgi:murein DD-endopeptidase MepM/ murein hydrolase activator NlpD